MISPSMIPCMYVLLLLSKVKVGDRWNEKKIKFKHKRIGRMLAKIRKGERKCFRGMNFILSFVIIDSTSLFEIFEFGPSKIKGS